MPATFNWVAPNFLPAILPWLSVLALFLFRPNRSGSAWWIWAPVLGCFALESTMRNVFASNISSEPLDFICQITQAFFFSLAAVWLLSPYLAQKNRFLTFITSTLALGGFSMWTLFTGGGIGWDSNPPIWAVAIFLLVGLLVFSVALSLAGLFCRRRYGPIRLSLWSMVCFLVMSTLAILPFYIIATIQSRSSVPTMEFIAAVLGTAGVMFAALLPFLLLSFVNEFYRERLKDLLHLRALAQPPPPAPPIIVAPPVGMPAGK
jgi:hypothetical protein